MSTPKCRTCGAASVSLLGSLPEGSVFAGQSLPTSLPGGSLWRCMACGFVFRDPLLSDQVYEDLYRNGKLGVWDSEQIREDFRLVREELLSSEGTQIDVLDIGCYTGQLLTSLPSTFRIFGVEPSKEAARIAAIRGVTIVAETLNHLATINSSYDVITACDVIEHVPNPLQFLMQLRSKLNSGGCIVLTTGNCDSWLWRYLGSTYWYCYFPEHISFIGTKWVREVNRHMPLQLVRFTPFNYRGGGVSIPRLVAALLHQWSPDLYRSLRRRSASAGDNALPPGGGAIKDHMLCVFEAA
jgi:SAM-dependent methyltransferase